MGRWRSVGRTARRVVGLVALLAAALVLNVRVLGQDPGSAQAWHAVVDADRVNIHSGRAEQFEKIGTLKRGDVLLVKSVNTFGWAAVAPPRGLHGFVARQDVADGSETGTVKAIGRAPVLYPISEDPAQCFRKYRVAPDTVLKVLAEVPTADKGVFLKVELPEQVDVYVLAQFIRKATAEEVAAWKAKMAEQASATETEAPTTVPLIPLEPPIAEPKAESPGAPPTTPEEDNKADPATPEPLKPNVAPATEEPSTPIGEEPTPPPAEAGTEPATAPIERPVAQPEPEIEKPVEVMLSGLEQLYGEMTRVPIAEAEIEPLLSAYQALEQRTEKEGERRVAEIRVALLQVRLDHQQAMRKLADAAHAAQAPSATPRVEVWRDEQGRPVFTAQGLLISSNVFDGRRLPLLYRVQDSITGRTIAYLRADEAVRLELERRLNLNVGIVGETVHDAGLRLDVIEVERIVDLAPDE